MKPSKELLRRVMTKAITPTELVAEVRDLAPRSARYDRSHPWWRAEADELLGILELVSTGSAYLSVSEAVREAIRTKGKVVIEHVSSTVVYKVLPVVQAEVVVTNQVVEQAMPTEFVDPVWDEDLPSLETFRTLSEHRYLLRLLNRHRWNVTKAAEEAEVARQTLTALLARHGLKRPGTSTEESTPETEPLRVAV